MKKIFTYRLLAFAIVCIFMLQTQVAVAQWTLDVMGSIKKEETKKRMDHGINASHLSYETHESHTSQI